LLFSTIYHLQIDSQTNVIDMTYTLLRTIIQKNLRNQEDCLSFIEFACNKSMHSTTDYSLFDIVYDFNNLTSLDLFSLPIDEMVIFYDNKKARVVKALYENMRRQIQKTKDE
jgi:hypothetical protein